MKKLLLGLGTIAVVATPVVATVSCSKDVVFEGLTVTYDKDTKLITMDFKKVSLSLMESKEYKEIKEQLEAAIETYNGDKTSENMDVVNSFDKKISDAASDYFKNLPVEAFINLMNVYGQAIIDNPGAIGILIKDRGIKVDVDEVTKDASLLENKEWNSLLTFNFGPDEYDKDKITRETFETEFGKPFVMPKHGKWETAGEWLKSIKTGELKAAVEKIKKTPIDLSVDISEEDKAKANAMFAKLKTAYNNPSTAMQVYIYLIYTGTKIVDSDYEWTASHMHAGQTLDISLSDDMSKEEFETIIKPYILAQNDWIGSYDKFDVKSGQVPDVPKYRFKYDGKEEVIDLASVDIQDVQKSEFQKKVDALSLKLTNSNLFWVSHWNVF